MKKSHELLKKLLATITHVAFAILPWRIDSGFCRFLFNQLGANMLNIPPVPVMLYSESVLGLNYFSIECLTPTSW